MLALELLPTTSQNDLTTISQDAAAARPTDFAVAAAEAASAPAVVRGAEVLLDHLADVFPSAARTGQDPISLLTAALRELDCSVVVCSSPKQALSLLILCSKHLADESAAYPE